MQQLKTVLSETTWSSASATINANNATIQEAVTQVELATVKHKGYFLDVGDLKMYYPSPHAGQIAYVYNSSNSASTPYDVYSAYNDDDSGWIWRDTGQDAAAPSVDINSIESELTRLDEESIANYNSIEMLRTEVEDLPSIRDKIENLEGQQLAYYRESSTGVTISDVPDIALQTWANNDWGASLSVSATDDIVFMATQTSGGSYAMLEGGVATIQAAQSINLNGTVNLNTSSGGTRITDVAATIDSLNSGLSNALTQIQSLYAPIQTHTSNISTLTTNLSNEISRAKAAEEELNEAIGAKQDTLQSYTEEITDGDGISVNVQAASTSANSWMTLDSVTQAVMLASQRFASSDAEYGLAALTVMPDTIEASVATEQGSTSVTMDGTDVALSATNHVEVKAKVLTLHGENSSTNNTLNFSSSQVELSCQDSSGSTAEGELILSPEIVNLQVGTTSDKATVALTKNEIEFIADTVSVQGIFALGDNIPDLETHLVAMSEHTDSLLDDITAGDTMSQFRSRLDTLHSASLTLPTKVGTWERLVAYIPAKSTVTIQLIPNTGSIGATVRFIYNDNTYTELSVTSTSAQSIYAELDVVRIDILCETYVTAPLLSISVNYLPEDTLAPIQEAISTNYAAIEELREEVNDVQLDLKRLPTLEEQVAMLTPTTVTQAEYLDMVEAGTWQAFLIEHPTVYVYE